MNNAPHLTLRVPANKAGRSFIARLRSYANYEHIARIRVRYSGPRKKHQRDTKPADATTLRVYIDTRAERALLLRMYGAEALATSRLSNIERLHHELEGERSIVRQYEEHLIAHAANVSRQHTRIEQCPRWVWWVIDIPKRVRAWRESRSGWVLP